MCSSFLAGSFIFRLELVVQPSTDRPSCFSDTHTAGSGVGAVPSVRRGNVSVNPNTNQIKDITLIKNPIKSVN